MTTWQVLFLLYLVILALRERRCWKENSLSLCSQSKLTQPAQQVPILSVVSSSLYRGDSSSSPAPSILPEPPYPPLTSKSPFSQRRNGPSTMRGTSSQKRTSRPIRRAKSPMRTSESLCPDIHSRPETKSTSTDLFPELSPAPFATLTSGSHECGSISGQNASIASETQARGIQNEQNQSKIPETPASR